jgi:HrpA-like RNA helicase
MEDQLPTLLRRGFVQHDKSNNNKMKNMKSVDYIMEFIADRITLINKKRPKITSQSIGDRVLVIKSETGSGKSTVLPAYIYMNFLKENKVKNVLVTQPRIFTAMDTPRIIASLYPDIHMDKNIGYSTGPFKRSSVENGILFSTIGVLSQQLILEEPESIIKKYKVIIIDEVHERDIDTDMCLFLLKKFLQENYSNPDCPLVILTSATFDEKLFMRYFEVPKLNYIRINGSTFEIKENFPNYSIANCTEYATLKAKKLHLENLEDLEDDVIVRDIVVFVKDAYTAKKIYDSLNAFNSDIMKTDIDKIAKNIDSNITALEKKGGAEKKDSKKYYVLPIMLDKKNLEAGGLEYQNLLTPIENTTVPVWSGKVDYEKAPTKYAVPTRRIIVATNVAETGVTIPTLKYCIDTGYFLNIEFNPEVGCFLMYNKNITRGMAIQRKGRVGRKAPGEWYPCYTKETFEYLYEDQLSKIILTDTTPNILSMLIKEKGTALERRKTSGPDTFQTFRLTDSELFSISNPLPANLSGLDFIEMPSMQMLSYSVEKLHILGFINDNYDITETGYYANQIRFLSLECRKMVLAGFYYGANILDLITISSFVFITKRNIFEKGFKIPNFIKKSDPSFDVYNRILIADEFINCVFVWNIFQSFLQKSLSCLNSEMLSDPKGKKLLYSETIKKWCVDNGIKHYGLMSVIAIRDQIIENLITIGINPYKNSLGLNKHEYNLNKIIKMSLEDGAEEIKKIKYSIYEGFKCNILVNKYNSYSNLLRNVIVKVKTTLVTELNSKVAEQTKPMFLATDSITITTKQNSAQFEFVADGFFSVLDNFVDVDLKFNLY